MLYFDIETQRTNDPVVINRLHQAVKPPGQYKKPESIAEWMAREGAAARVEAVAKTALDGTYGRLATFAYCVDGQEPVVLSGQSCSERELLVNIVTALQYNRANVDSVIFNGEFDVRFLYQRAVVNGVRIKHILPDLNRKGSYFDPMKEWAGYRGYISQADLEVALSLTRHDDIDGSQVGECIDAGDWLRVHNHNLEDVRLLREIYQRMNP